MIALITELIKYVNTLDGVCGRINIDSKEKKIIYILEFEILENELDSFKEKIKSYEINELNSLLCILIVILILIYKHNELYTQINLYKRIVDLLLP